MKEGFLFGLGFSLVYFTIHYACIAATYYLSKWEFARRGRAMQDAMEENKRAAENVAAQERQPNWKDFTN